MVFFRTLGRASGAMIAEAAAEIIIIAILCLLPLVGVAFGAYLHQAPVGKEAWESFGSFLSQNIAKGQLAFYAISNWATVIWLCGREYKNLFPWRVVLIVLSVFGFYYCGILIDPIKISARAEPSVLVSSTVLYGISMLCYFLIVLYGKIPPLSAEDTNLAEAKSLRGKLKDLRGSHG